MEIEGGSRASPRRTAGLSPWWYGLGVALALLVLPITAWFAFPSVKGAPESLASANASGEAEGESSGAARTASKKKRAIAGSVVDETGEPLTGAKVTILLGEETVGSFVTKKGGRFTIRAPEGAVTVKATAPSRESASIDVTDPGDVRGLELQLRPGADTRSPAASGPVNGTVVDGSGTPVAEAYVACESDPKLSATTDAKGQFTLPPEADGCTASASHPEHPPSAGITLAAGGKNRIELASPGKITGSVIDDRGKPITSFGIGIESFTPAAGDKDQPFGRQRHFDSPLGEFELDDLAPGRYVLSANAEGKPPSKSRPIDVESGQRARGVQITISAGATLTGSVSDRETHKGVPGVTVRLDAAVIGGSATTATTDASGRYTLTGVPSGPFSVRFTHDDYKDRIVSLDASTATSLKQDVDLAKKGSGGSDMEMTGIGATLNQGSKFVEVMTLVSGGPAEAAGLKPGDRIERIEGVSAESFSVNDCVNRLRGPEGTRVSLTVGRGTQHLDINITRAKIER